jgi:hypothetical protein
MTKYFIVMATMFAFFCLTYNHVNGQVTLYSEPFTYANGTTEGAGAPSSWTRNLNGNNPSTFSVQSNVFTATNTGGEVIWSSRIIPVQAWLNVSLSVSLSATANMETDDYIRVYYKLNGGAETLFQTNGNNTGNYSARNATHKGLSGNTVQIIIRIKNNASNETHAFDNVVVSGSNRFYEEDFNSYANGTTTSSLWSINNPGNVKTFSVQNGEFQYRNSAQTAIWSSSVINISDYPSVNLQVTLRENSNNTLENSDWIEVLYRLNGGAETRFATNGYFADDFPSPYTFTASQNNLSGNTVQIIIKAKTNADDEYYYWDDVFMTANLNAPPSMSLSTNVIPVTGCEEGNTNGRIELTVTDGHSPFTYHWSNGATTQYANNVGVGTYTVTVTDYLGHTATTSAQVTHPALVVVTVHKTPPTSNYKWDGKLDLTVSGGTPPYTYAWSNGKTTQDIDSIQSGSYTWLVTDSVGCFKTRMEYLVYYDTIKKGSFIINMGVTPQTIANGLKPYGLIYQLVRNHKVPVLWSINPDKDKDGKDFTYNGVDYKGGTFIIEEGFITNNVKNLITTWQNKGVVGVYTSSPVVVPVYQHITGFANVVVDSDNENLIIPYFNNAEVPDSIYTVGLPSSLGACHDFFILPHADPTWADHGNLYTFNRTRKGHIWTGCHATSVLEGTKNPLNPSQQMNFLTRSGLQCYKSGKCGDILEVHDAAHTNPVSYDTAYHSHPIMQFMGDMTGATNNGSERWYIPVSTGGWNANVARALKTSDGSSGREGVKLAFGYGYNNPLNGIVMYEAGHTAHNNGTVPERVAAQRAFFNFILHASIEKTITSKGNIPKTFINMVGQTVSVNVSGGNPPYTYRWTATVPGTFSNPNAAVTTFTPTGGQADRSYYITCQIQDACGRISVLSAPVEFLDIEGVATNVTCYGGTDGSINITVIGGTPPFTFEWSNGANTEDISGIAAGDYEVVVTDANGYSQNAFFTVEQPTEIAVTDSVIPVTYVCSTDGAIYITASGATPPYTYHWSTGANTSYITGLQKANYAVTVKDSRNCQKTFTIGVTGPDDLSINFSPVNVNTYDAATGSIQATPGGGTAPYTYAWCNGSNSGNITNQKPGPYSLTVTDAGGCTVSGSSVIGVDHAFTFNGLRFGETTEMSWNASSHWDSGQIPTSEHNVVIPAGCAATVTIPVNVAAKDIFIAEGAGVVVTNGNDMQIKGNFILNGSFVAGTGNVIFSGSGEQRIISNKVVEFYKLTMQNTSSTGLLIDTNIVIQNQLALNDGHIFTGQDDTVIVTNVASNAITNHTSGSYIVGNLCRHISNNSTVTYDFPLGYGQPTEYFKASVISKSLKTTSKITGTVIPMERSALLFDPNETLRVSDEAISYVYVHPEALWILEPDTQPTAGTYDLRLYTENVPNITDNYFGIIKRIRGGTDNDWVADFGSSSTFGGEGRLRQHGYALKKGATSFSEFGIGSGRSNPLPIELISFDARIKEDGKTHLQWYTATEINNDYFTIERVKNITDKPEEILHLKGAGNSATLNSYHAIDHEPYDGISYYRLKQTDFDGRYSYSEWVAVRNNHKTAFAFSIYPNPADKYADFNFSNVQGELSIVIFDAMSNIVYSKSFIEKDSKILYRLNFSGFLSKGTYFVQVVMNGEVHLQKLIVQ